MAESVKPTVPDEVRREARTAGAERGFGVGVHSRTVLTSDGLNAAIKAAYAAGAADERARIVADLRALGWQFNATLADRYERGEHLGD